MELRGKVLSRLSSEAQEVLKGELELELQEDLRGGEVVLSFSFRGNIMLYQWIQYSNQAVKKSKRKCRNKKKSGERRDRRKEREREKRGG